jgi:tetratricopeptide (TPR) repeat protein
LKHVEGLAITLADESGIFYDRGDHDRALQISREAATLFRELGDDYNLHRQLGNQAIVLNARDDLEGSLACYGEMEQVCLRARIGTGLLAALHGQARMLYFLDDLHGAVAEYERHAKACRELGDKDQLRESLAERSAILEALGKRGSLLEVLKEYRDLLRELKDWEGEWSVLAMESVILDEAANLAAALEVLNDQERLCRENADPKRLAITTANKASVMGRMAIRSEEALRLAEEALRMADTNGYDDLLGEFRRIRDFVQRHGM